MDKAVAAKQLTRTPKLGEVLEFGHVLKSYSKDSMVQSTSLQLYII